MILSKPQQQRFWREWSAACRAQGWTAANTWTSAQIETERHALLSRAGFDSLTQVDKLAGFDRLLAELAALTHPADIEPQLREQAMPLTRLKFACRTLAGQIVRHSPVLGNSDAYIRSIALDKFGSVDLDALSEAQLIQLRNTLSARLSAKRRHSPAANPELAAISAECTDENNPF